MRRSPFATRLAISALGILLVPDVVTTRAQVCSIHERQKLTVSDAVEWDQFGSSMCISGDRAIIGAPYNDGLGDRSGSAYVFRRDDSATALDPTDDFWVPEDKLLPSDGSGGDRFGHSVSISGDWAIVGATRDDDACPSQPNCDSGSAYVFRRDDNDTPSDPSDDSWIEEAKLTASDAAPRDYFGSVSISGDRAIVGATWDDACPGEPTCNSGSAYVFRRDNDDTPLDPSDDFWIEEAKLTASDAAAGDYFGSVSISEKRVVVGAWGDNHAGSDSGSCYVFRLEGNGTPLDPTDDFWIQEVKLTASDAAAGDCFGLAVSISGDRAIVGAHGDEDAGWVSGSAYLFRWDDAGTPSDPSDDFWGEVQKLTALDASQTDYFGLSVSINGDRAIVAASGDGNASGSAYVYRRDDNGTPLDPNDDFWVHLAKHTASDADAFDRFGRSVSISGDRAIVGASRDDDAGESSGSAYVFTVRIDGTEDCNCNLVADATDIAEGTSEDCNTNDIPDECELDCNGNGIHDDCDIASEASADCNASGIPDECETDCNNNGLHDDCDIADGTSDDCNANAVPDECEEDCNGSGVPDDCDITDGTSEDCNGNGTPDECDILVADCNSNAIPDDCDVVTGSSEDCTSNGIPDECEPDCNENNVADSCDIADGTSEDCSGNGIPDECEPDCNANSIADSCDIYMGISSNCNRNGRPDECDIADGTSEDLDANGVPDECAEIRWRPVAADGYVVCLPGEDPCGETEIMLSGGGVVVTLFLELTGWAGDPHADSLLGGYQGTVDSRTYLGGLAPGEVPGHPGNPGTLESLDLYAVGWLTGMAREGAFIALTVCTSPVHPCFPCWEPLSHCPETPCESESWWCYDRPDFVYAGLEYVVEVSTAQREYSWFGATPDCAYDSGTFKYGGTLLLEVPAGATGTYNVGFFDDINFTMMNSCTGHRVSNLKLTDGQITIVTGRCCSNIGAGTTVCEDGLSQPECDARPGLSQFTALESCAGAEVADCNDNGVPDECEPDDDGDGVIDACDGCPDDPNKTEPGICGCGLDDNTDSDGDDVPDCFDECPGVDDALFAPSCVDAIPTVSAWGLAVLTLLLLAAGKVCFTRRRESPA
ncbi:MAG: FG-GAP repeat protein [Planctomycetota bacterium]|jgi:hypothetical protein